MTALTVQNNVNVTAGLDSNTRSQVLQLNPGKNRIWVYSDAWDGTKAAALKYSPIPDDTALGAVKDTDGEVSFTQNDGIDLEGPGFVCFDLTGADGDEVFMTVQQCALL